ncbi:hypothetical protein chiPu_0025066 [Chiloscyllium punctatum]|uniref:DUF3456 domain-containing protein n=1 Tax=Chiloscyllium punctatum TaxID=137246 RepID=A0A401TEY5_CHIPU|nr:hypothetical protein [Chiloscyllium punctatum]
MGRGGRKIKLKPFYCVAPNSFTLFCLCVCVWCEVCKFLTLELQSALDKTKHSKEVLELGEVLDNGKRKRKIKYNTSETRLADAMDNICVRILQYNIHAERPGSLRYAKVEVPFHKVSIKSSSILQFAPVPVPGLKLAALFC